MYMIFECGDKVYAVYNHNIIRVEDNMLSGNCNIVGYNSYKSMQLDFKADSIDPTDPIKIDKIHCFESEKEAQAKLLELVKPKPVEYNCRTMPNNTMGIVVSGFASEKYKNATVVKINDKVTVYTEHVVEFLTNPSFIINLTHDIKFTETTS